MSGKYYDEEASVDSAIDDEETSSDDADEPDLSFVVSDDLSEDETDDPDEHSPPPQDDATTPDAAADHARIDAAVISEPRDDRPRVVTVDDDGINPANIMPEGCKRTRKRPRTFEEELFQQEEVRQLFLEGASPDRVLSSPDTSSVEPTESEYDEDEEDAACDDEDDDEDAEDEDAEDDDDEDEDEEYGSQDDSQDDDDDSQDDDSQDDDDAEPARRRRAAQASPAPDADRALSAPRATPRATPCATPRRDDADRLSTASCESTVRFREQSPAVSAAAAPLSAARASPASASSGVARPGSLTHSLLLG